MKKSTIQLEMEKFSSIIISDKQIFKLTMEARGAAVLKLCVWLCVFHLNRRRKCESFGSEYEQEGTKKVIWGFEQKN